MIVTIPSLIIIDDRNDRMLKLIMRLLIGNQNKEKAKKEDI